MLNTKIILPLILLIFGGINILLIKWSDRQYSKGRDDKQRLFEHPFIQTITLFYGEFLCFILYKILYLYLSRKRDGSEDTNFLTAGEREFSPFIFIVPAVCDLISTYLSFMGLYLTDTSSYLMLRAGISLIFIGIFSVHYLDFTLEKHHWFGMLIIILSTVFLCISDKVFPNQNLNLNNSNSSINSILTGNLLIIISCIFRSYQCVYEEKHLKILNLPILQVIGWEGIYGTLISLILLIPFNFINGTIPFNNNPYNVIEDIYDAIIQIKNNYNILISFILYSLFIIIEVYSIKSITKDTSCTNVILINSFNIIYIWLIVLMLEWEWMNYLKLLSFILLYSGICIYKNVIFKQLSRVILMTLLCNRRRDDGDNDEEVINQPADAVTN